MRGSILLLISCLIISGTLVADPVPAGSSPAPRLAEQQVLTAAKAEMQKQGINLALYKLRPPEYRAEKGKWWVVAIRQPDVTRSAEPGHQVTAATPLHADYLVTVDDLSGSTCGQYEYNIGPCT